MFTYMFGHFLQLGVQGVVVVEGVTVLNTNYNTEGFAKNSHLHIS
jgi:hypothetical protein